MLRNSESEVMVFIVLLLSKFLKVNAAEGLETLETIISTNTY